MVGGMLCPVCSTDLVLGVKAVPLRLPLTAGQPVTVTLAAG